MDRPLPNVFFLSLTELKQGHVCLDSRVMLLHNTSLHEWISGVGQPRGLVSNLFLGNSSQTGRTTLDHDIDHTWPEG